MLKSIDSSALYGIGGIVATVISSLFFYWLGQRFTKRRLLSVERERILRAKEALLAIIESYIIEKKTISIEVINDRIEAIERKEEIQLEGVCTPISLLQDAALRLDSTQYLNVDQKQEISLLINNQINAIKQGQAEHDSYSSQDIALFEGIKEKIKAQDFEAALAQLDQVKANYDGMRKSSLDERVKHFRFTSMGLFMWFWIYNGVVGFSPLISETFLNYYHWYIFVFGVLISVSFLVSPYQMPSFFRVFDKPNE